MTLSIVLLCRVSIMLSVIHAECHMQTLNAECHYAECRYAGVVLLNVVALKKDS
jgi:hypothetical protein